MERCSVIFRHPTEREAFDEAREPDCLKDFLQADAAVSPPIRHARRWDVAEVPMWALGPFARILCDTLAPGEVPVAVAAYRNWFDAEPGDVSYRFEVDFEWWHDNDDGPYRDSFEIIVYHSRETRTTQRRVTTA
jgi:hypothetical protein